MITVQFYYFDGCPGHIKTYQNLEHALKAEGIHAEIEAIKIESMEDAEKNGFQGSPSIRINGIDLEDRNQGFSFNCRLYEIEGKLTGIPSEEYITIHLRRILSSGNRA